MLAVMMADWRPVWTLGSAGAIRTFPVLPGIESLTIFADADDAGERAASECAARWRESGRQYAYRMGISAADTTPRAKQKAFGLVALCVTGYW